jgi:hypothetical protein
MGGEKMADLSREAQMILPSPFFEKIEGRRGDYASLFSAFR